MDKQKTSTAAAAAAQQAQESCLRKFDNMWFCYSTSQRADGEQLRRKRWQLPMCVLRAVGVATAVVLHCAGWVCRAVLVAPSHQFTMYYQYGTHDSCLPAVQDWWRCITLKTSTQEQIQVRSSMRCGRWLLRVVLIVCLCVRVCVCGIRPSWSRRNGSGKPGWPTTCGRCARNRPRISAGARPGPGSRPRSDAAAPPSTDTILTKGRSHRVCIVQK